LPKCFFNLKVVHQADYIRVNIICKYGGIWLDSDTIYLNDFDIDGDGFFIIQGSTHLCNGVFASKANTQLMLEWKKNRYYFKCKGEKIGWTDIGNMILIEIKTLYPKYLDKYKIYNGMNTMYPIEWNYCVDEYIKKPYENYKNLIRDFQPFIVLVNSVYKEWDKLKDEDRNKTPLSYFLK